MKKIDPFIDPNKQTVPKLSAPTNESSMSLRVNDFSSFLSLVSDLKVKNVTSQEIYLKNDSMDIIINKEKFIDSLLVLGTNNYSQSDPQYVTPPVLKTRKSETPLEYFPFNPTFQTSDEVKKERLGPNGVDLSEIDEEEQESILQAIESYKSESLGLQTSKSKSMNHFDNQVTKVESKASSLQVQNDLSNFLISGNEETPVTNNETTHENVDDSDFVEVDEQGGAKVSSNGSNTLSEVKSTKQDPFDTEFFGQNTDIPTSKEEVKENPKKPMPFDFSALDDMGDLLDMDLDGNMNEDEYLGVLMQPKGKFKKQSDAQEFCKIVPNEDEL